MEEAGQIPWTRLVEIGGEILAKYDSIRMLLTETVYQMLKQ
jgi:uncharacterized protein with HEPN domain